MDPAPAMHYDVIGDVHGHAERLSRLLDELGYRQTHGEWTAPAGRQAVFVGDLIDRGPRQRETVRIVRAMVDNGSAQMVLGNHEFNAVAFATADPERDDYCRSHSDKNLRQHQTFLKEVGFGSATHRSILDWFLSLPLWLDLGGIRVVHACWSESHMDTLANLLHGHHLTTDAVIAASRAGSPAYDAVEALLKGPEIGMEGHYYFDKSGIRRDRARVRWWDTAARTLRDAAHLPQGAPVFDQAGREVDALPDTELGADIIPAYRGDVPVVVGHYWQTGPCTPLSSKVACVDYSAGNGGPLVAYRWRGGTTVDASGFLAV